MSVGIEDAGFEIRDSIAWLRSQGMPKGKNLPGGWSTALKTSYEPIVVARKPLVGTVTDNVAAHGTGALNVGASRVNDRWPPNAVISHECGDVCGPGCPVIDLGDQAAFFPAFRYEAKPSRAERAGNPHPTPKPLALMEWLVKLVTPINGVVLDPFAGSGSTGVAAVRAGFSFVGIEKEQQYVELAKRRLESITADSPAA
jgi:site-specific DNA-methyltransferase (adenine-specific)